MIVPYPLLKRVILIEIILVVLIIIFAYLVKYYYHLRAKRDQRISAQIEKFLTSGQQVDGRKWPHSWQRLDILLPLIFKLDQNPPASWDSVKSQTIRTVVLPLARKKYKSHKWMNRLLSAQAFELNMEPQDKERVARLLGDKIPLIHMHAAIAAIKSGDEMMINQVINGIAQKRRLGQSIYLKMFENASPDTVKYIAERLNKEKDPYVKATGYKILGLFPASDQGLDFNQDMQSDNTELTLAAMRYSAYSSKQNAVPALVRQLSNDKWEVRALSNRLLGELQAVEAISEVAKGLNDPIWWVRVSAAQALKNMGGAGLRILNEQNPNADLFAYETAMHVLNKPLT